MSTASIQMLSQTRRLTRLSLRGLSEEQWFIVPENFENNVAWNIGHMLYVTESLIYRVSGAQGHFSPDFKEMYRPGTSPADWSSRPDTALLKELVKSQPSQLKSDFEADLFQNFRPIKTSTGVEINTLEESMIFNNYHEGLHLGTILSLRNALGL